jgi:flagellar biosynthesis/type III secretory pathway M-ring protein FliF/YscJ
MTRRQKWALAILIAVALIVIVAASAVTFFYVKYYKPLFMENGAAAISARLENTLTNKAEATATGGANLPR